MKKRLLPLNKKVYRLFLETLKKYQNVKQRLYLNSSVLTKPRLEKKLILSEKHLLPINIKALTVIATVAVLTSTWLANPVQAQFPAEITLDTLGSRGLTILGGENVFSVGDVNGDEIDDFLITTSGSTIYVAFGSALFDGDTLDVSDLDGSNGIAITGSTGNLVNGAGDVNGDELYDIIIAGSSATYVVFGDSLFASGSLDVSDMNTPTGPNGFTISIFAPFTLSSISDAGDVNGDGYDDVMLASTSGAGIAYVIFGDSLLPDLSLDTFDISSDGFVIIGEDATSFGSSVSGAGDVNDDGYDDVIIGAPLTPPSDGEGESYVVFGDSLFTPDTINISSNLFGRGVIIGPGVSIADLLGTSVSDAGDVNGDGIDDFIVGAPQAAQPAGGINTGRVYVKYGGQSFPTTVPASGGGNGGFTITGAINFDKAGTSISGAGDVNVDGYDDLLVIGGETSINNRRAYVIFGGPSIPTDLRLDTALNGSNGFTIVDDVNSVIASGPGDINGDGVDDVFIGEYIIYGIPVPTPNTPALTSDVINICREDSITISIDEDDNLNSGSNWFLYADSINGTLIDSATNGIFTIPAPVDFMTYLVRGEGNGFIGVEGTIDITVVNSVTPSILQTGLFLVASPGSGATYEWINCADSTIIPNQTESTFTPTMGESYAVIVTDICTDTSACFLVTGIDENSFGSEISLYPNPTNGDVLLELGEIKDAVITLSDVTGKIVSEVRSGNRNSILLPLRDFDHGIYFITIAASNEQKVMKLIKE